MASLQKLQKLSGAHCVLLAAHYATESNIAALRVLTTLRDADLPLDLTLSILLTYLPEELEPSSYVEYLNELATDARDAGADPATAVNVSTVEELSVSRAKKKRKGLELVPVVNPLYAVESELDLFSHFLINRAHRIDAQTGLLDLVPQLVVPFLGHSEYLRTWFISTVLPLLRLSYEYYPQSQTKSLEDFAKLQGRPSIEYQLSNVRHAKDSDTNHIARDLKGVVSPWMCGANERKRRKLSGGGARRASIVEQEPQEPDDWSSLFQWLLHTAKDNLELATVAFSEWDGPEDMDLGGFEEGRDYVDDEQQRGLEMQYAQAAIASLYIGEKSDIATLQMTCKLLERICGLLNYDPPPDLHIGPESLPSYDLKDSLLSKCTLSSLREERLLNADCLLTRPGENSVQIAKLILFSAVVLSSLQQPMSPRELCKIILRQDKNEQFSLLQKILHTLVASSKDNDQWSTFRLKILWLWNWGVEEHGDKSHVNGVIGLLEGSTVESEILKALIENSRYDLAVQIYIRPSPGRTPLPLATVEQIALSSALHHYDNASNGNRTRGGMKRAYDIVGAFAPHFEQSSRFQRMQALLKATNAMSYYSLILQHGVPFQPVNIRVSSNPLSLIRKLLSQNKGSYTKLDDLIAIGQNLVTSRPSALMDEDESAVAMDQASLEQKKATTERRVTGMAIEAALEEDDFETAYSYVVNRLSPSDPSPTPSITQKNFSFHSKDSGSDDQSAEDIAWRAALRAGRYNAQSAPSDPWAAPAASSTIPRPALRQLEQRMELLSQALLLAPPNHLEEVLKVWQDCEAEMISLLAQDAEQEQRFNDAADRKLPGTFISDTITVQPRREIGRGAAEEAPMGLFDVARGAAAAFSKSAFPLHGARTASNPKGGDGGSMNSSRVSLDTDEASLHGEDRVRKRDMVATVASGALNTGTGALASGLGWMLGAKPVNEQERH